MSKGRYVLGVYQGHDAGIAIVGEGRICHLATERYSRLRHDGHSSAHQAQMYSDALSILGITNDQVIAVVGVSGALGAAPNGWSDLNEVKKYPDTSEFGGFKPLFGIPHHTAHMAYAFWTSPHERMRLAALDGGGDPYILPFWDALTTTCAVGGGDWKFGADSGSFGARWVADPHIGGQWINASYKLFRRANQEGSVMALLGLPEQRFQELTGLDPSIMSLLRELQIETSEAVNRLFPPAPNPEPVGFAGGCALNGVAVYDLLRMRGDISGVWVPPAVDDGGICVGSALHVLHRVFHEPRHRISWRDVAYAGFEDDELQVPPDGMPTAEIAQALANGKIVAVAAGRAESGPRALGNRSLLGDPREVKVRDKLNRIKGRQPWRPTAPVVLRKYAHAYFNLISPESFRFMTTICDSTELARKVVPAAIHYDGSARVQIVDEDEAWVGRILSAFHAETNCPVILNTSFNIAGEAMVNSADDARNTFARSPEIDILVLGGKMIRKDRE